MFHFTEQYDPVHILNRTNKGVFVVLSICSTACWECQLSADMLQYFLTNWYACNEFKLVHARVEVTLAL